MINDFKNIKRKVVNVTISLTFRLVFVLIVCEIFFSCSNSDIKTKKIISEWSLKEIIFPKKITYKSLSQVIIGNNILNHQYKILVFVDSVGCTSCQLGLIEWKAFIDHCERNFYDLGFLFVVQSRNYSEFTEKLKLNRFTYPIIYDSKDEFNRLNQFPKENKYRTFLLNENNQVILIGSPIKNEKIWKLYIEIIQRGKKVSIKPVELGNDIINLIDNTTINIPNDYINLGKFGFNSVKHASFKIKNNGKKQLIIQTVNTSCGCTAAKYEKKPIAKGETTTVILEYKPNSLGYFSKTADVVCNVPEGYVRLTISGEVVEK